FVHMPLRMLMNPMYAAGLRAGISLNQATPSQLLPPIASHHNESPDTTHFSILDSNGNRVAATVTINYPFGSGFMPPGTGVLLNNEMDDFSAKPGSPNIYELVSGEANAIEPGKRMLSSMTPTFLDTGERMAIVGTPGGGRITSMMLLATLAFINGADAQDMVSRLRFHHQYLPDEIQFEPDAINARVARRLKAMGHALSEEDEDYGNMQVVIWDRKQHEVSAASDPRGSGAATVRTQRRKAAMAQ
ncbi:MAG TPA: gamma-glutamyltransferase, partial [Gammaproteobacteria bacterium]|nr:gamma-glutamyltransferase [Gammaproteobacteria bacterium]